MAIRNRRIRLYNKIHESKLPVSTYKIINSIIARETGVVEDETSFFEWDLLLEEWTSGNET